MSSNKSNTSVLPNSAQSLSDPQQSLLDNIKYPEGWLSPNPELTPSPFPWSGSYISPAWYGSYGQHGNGMEFEKSNQFNSAVTQPLGLHVDWLGRENTVGQRMVNQQGGMVEPSDEFKEGYSMVLQKRRRNMPSQRFQIGGKKKYSKRK